MLRKSLTVAGFAVVLLGVLSGCNGSSDPVSSTLGGGFSGSELAAVALESDLRTESVINEELDSMPASFAPQGLTQDVTFNRTRSCPAGGRIEVSGTIHRSYDPDTTVMEADISGSRTRTDCTFGFGPMTLTVNGSSQWEVHRRRVGGEPDGPQTGRFSGSLTLTRSDGTERTCDFDYTILRDPATDTREINGTMCGSHIGHKVPWNHRD